MELAKGNWRNAFHLFNNTLEDANQINSTEESFVSRSYLSKLAFLQGNFQTSIEELTTIYKEAQQLQDVRALAQFGLWLADWSLQLGSNSDAEEYLEAVSETIESYNNKEYRATYRFLMGQSKNSLTGSMLNDGEMVADHAHRAIYIHELIHQARAALQAGSKDISAHLSALEAIDYKLYQYEYIEYLELLAVQQYYSKDWSALAETLREADLLLRKMGDYWRSFQLDRLRAQLAIAEQKDAEKYHSKVRQKLKNLAENLPPERLSGFLEKQDYYQLDDSLQEFAIGTKAL